MTSTHPEPLIVILTDRGEPETLVLPLTDEQAEEENEDGEQADGRSI